MTAGDSLDRPVDFRLLGTPMIPRSKAGSPPPRIIAVLAILLVSAGRRVGVEQVLDAFWSEDPPLSAPSNVSVFIHQVRRLLKAAGIAPGWDLSSVPAGYRLDVDPMTVDLHRFRALTAAAREEKSAGRRAGLLGDALALWDEPLPGIPGPWADELRRTLERERLAAERTRAELLLELGRAGEAVPPLERLVADHPLDEESHGLLMQALHATGRHDQARRVYARVERRLLDDLGIEPGPQLRALRDDITSTGPALPVPADEEPATPPWIGSDRRPGKQPPRAWELPAADDALIGRNRERRELARLLDPAADGAGIVVLHGPPGVGKSHLAAHVVRAALDAGWFPGGLLHASLRVNTPIDVMASFLEARGVAPDQLPADSNVMARLYRTRFGPAGRDRALILLDDVTDEQGVFPLLPPSGSDAVLVISRLRLPGLANAARIEVGPLPPDDVVRFLANVQAPDGRRLELSAAEQAQLAEVTQGLPLALTIITERLSRPGARADLLLRELDDARSAVSVPRVLALSVKSLGSGDADLLRRLALAPTADVSAEAAAVLDDAPEGTRGRLGRLAAAAVLQWSEDSARVRLPESMRQFLRPAPGEPIRPVDRPALHRLLEFYLERTRNGRTTGEWFQAEDENLHGAVRLAVELDRPDLAGGLAVSLHRFDASRGDWTRLAEVGETALDAVVRAGDRSSEAGVLTTLAHCDAQLGLYQSAQDRYRQAIALYRRLGEPNREAAVLTSLAWAEHQMGQWEAAEHDTRKGLELFRSAADRHGEARALTQLGETLREQGRGPEAIRLYSHALSLFRDIGDRQGEAVTLTGLGSASAEVDRLDESADFYRGAIAIFRELSDEVAESDALDRLGGILQAMGREDDAVTVYDRAFDSYRERPPDRLEPQVVRLAEYLASDGRQGWRSLLDHASRSPGRRPGQAELVSRHRADPSDVRALRRLLDEVHDLADRDSDVATELAAWLAAAEETRRTGISNIVTGHVSGTAVQGRDLFGTINFDIGR
ncbi:BTAD domain-containing putative transcriptional regulator [Amycolatopsis sp. NPDC051758]|uniref:AfsR/SARP family transcriptional regulator n=1 Tax=Amycolatopsis sp. NPDC051758 TaxID=3363935 RepID=UPI00379F29D1